jgi:hypothetical protein
MRPIDLARTGALACVLAACACATAQERLDDSAVSPVVAQQQKQEIKQGDPARWYKQPATQDGRLRNLQKEIGAAYAEAKKACAEQPKDQRASCLKDARGTYEQDMANARTTVNNPPQPEVTTTQNQAGR